MQGTSHQLRISGKGDLNCGGGGEWEGQVKQVQMHILACNTK